VTGHQSPKTSGPMKMKKVGANKRGIQLAWIVVLVVGTVGVAST
jgi:hypothetical protein